MKRTPKQHRLEVVEQRRLPGSVSPEFNQRCKDFFQRRFGAELTDEDVREIVARVTAFFDLLHEMKQNQEETGNE